MGVHDDPTQTRRQAENPSAAAAWIPLSLLLLMVVEGTAFDGMKGVLLSCSFKAAVAAVDS
jgi:hypothetical protein